jgi:hypothetical protein
MEFSLDMREPEPESGRFWEFGEYLKPLAEVDPYSGAVSIEFVRSTAKATNPDNSNFWYGKKGTQKSARFIRGVPFMVASSTHADRPK